MSARIGDMYAICVALLFLAPAAVPARASQGAVLLAALVGAVVLGRAWRRPTELAPAAKHALVAAGLVSLPVVFSAVLAVNKPVSAYGLAGQHAGAFTWLAALAWFVAALLASRPNDLRASATALAVGGAVYGGMAVLQDLGVAGSLIGIWGWAAGPLENSNSLAQLLVLCLGAAVAWFAQSTGLYARVAAGACATLVLAGLYAAHSAGAWVAVAAALAFAGVLAATARFERRARWIAMGSIALAVVLLVAVGAVALGAAGDAAFTRADAVSNLRFSMWRAAIHAIASHPIVGRGPDQFSAWILWGPTPDGGFQTQAANDPHNVWLAIALAAGVPGLLLALAGAGWALLLLVRAYDDSGRSPAVAALVCGLVGFATTAMFSWLSPAAVAAAGAIAGLILATNAEKTAVTKAPQLPIPAVFSVLALVGAALMVSPVLTEVRFAAAMGTPDASPAAAGIAGVESGSTDPAYVNAALAELLPLASSGDANALVQAQALLERRPQDRRWNVDLAASALAMAPASGGDTAQSVRDAVAAGKSADPGAGFWDYMGAIAADSVGDSETASDLAARALEFPDLAPTARAQMEALAR